jgi:hypothetical protein
MASRDFGAAEFIHTKFIICLIWLVLWKKETQLHHFPHATLMAKKKNVEIHASLNFTSPAPVRIYFGD